MEERLPPCVAGTRKSRPRIVDEELNTLGNATAAFKSLSMSGDAGFVKLNICEELLRVRKGTRRK
jgi:hypothetical protein